MSSQAVIHFVGLVVWTMQSLGPQTTLRVSLSGAQIQNQSTVVAIMPRVTGTETYPRLKAPAARVSNNEQLVTGGGTVEAHTAIIAFAPCDLLSSTGWEIKRLTDRLLYVELNGDRVTFRGDATNPRATLNDVSLLPHMGGSLQAEYAPTSTGPGTAAVFNIPQGAVRTCMADGKNDEGNMIHQRVDTYLVLKTSQRLTVDAGPKQLVLDGSAVVYAADVPAAWIATVSTGAPQSSTGSLPHYEVYCRMNGTAAACNPPAGSECTAIAPPGPAGAVPSPPAGCHYCGELQMIPRGGRDTDTDNARIFHLMNSECSNTRYP